MVHGSWFMVFLAGLLLVHSSWPKLASLWFMVGVRSTGGVIDIISHNF